MKPIPLSIILVEPENPDNIGSVARAMKNMNFNDLRLVKPPAGWKKKAKKMAVSGADLLETCAVFSEFKEAIKDRSMVIATTRRERRFKSGWLTFKEACDKSIVENMTKEAAFVFGKESKGLDNTTLMECDWRTTIPANPIYPSINLAQAVMIVCFSVYNSLVEQSKLLDFHPSLQAVQKEVIHDVLAMWKPALTVLGYEEKKTKVSDRILVTLHGLFKRNGLAHGEANMLKGIARRIAERAQKP